MKQITIFLTSLFFIGGLSAFAQSTTWKVGSDYSVKFSGKGVSGIFKTMNADITFDEKNLAASKFVVTIEVASLNTGNGMMNKHATGAEWFDAVKYPKIKFTSTSVEKSSTGYLAKGKMEVKGKSKDISIPFQFSTSGSSGQFTSALTIKRSDYGVGAAGNDVSDEIQVELKVPVTRS